jgi:hypothetical protein
MFMLVHICIRNDEHCPSCRQYYITLCNSLEECCELSPDPDRIQRGLSVWVDEWIRRRNGDFYIAKQVEPSVNYDLCNLEDTDFRISDGSFNPGWVVITTIVDRQKWCPENINFHVQFFATKGHAYIYLFNDYDWSSESKRKFVKEHVHWESDDDQSGTHVQLLDCNTTEIHLNQYCPQIQPSFWFSAA